MNGVAPSDVVEILDALLASISDPILRRVGFYWRSKAVDRRIPSRQDIEPIEIPTLLPYLTLIDVERAQSRHRFRFRLIGTKVTEWAGRDSTGLYLDSVDYGPHGAAIAEEYATIAETGRPRYDRRHARWPNREHKFYHQLMLPLARDGVVVDMLMGVVQVLPSRGKPD